MSNISSFFSPPHMRWSERTFLAVAGAGVMLSVGHYFAKCRTVAGRVPVHFNIFGVPDRTAAPWAFIMYPMISLGLTSMMVYTVLAPSAKAVLAQNSLEHISTHASLLYGQAVVLACQHSAAQIAEGSSDRISRSLMCLLYTTLMTVSVAMLAAKSTRQLS